MHRNGALTQTRLLPRRLARHFGLTLHSPEAPVRSQATATAVENNGDGNREGGNTDHTL